MGLRRNAASKGAWQAGGLSRRRGTRVLPNAVPRTPTGKVLVTPLSHSTGGDEGVQESKPLIVRTSQTRGRTAPSWTSSDVDFALKLVFLAAIPVLAALLFVRFAH